MTEILAFFDVMSRLCPVWSDRCEECGEPVELCSHCVLAAVDPPAEPA
jgi:hypothetical protein